MADIFVGQQYFDLFAAAIRALAAAKGEELRCG